MIQCPHCGEILDTPKVAKFCTNCGKTLAPSMQRQTTHIIQSRHSGRPSPSYRPWLILVGSVVTIGIIVISVILVASYFVDSLFGSSLGSGIEILSDTDFPKYSSTGRGSKDDPYILSNYYLSDEFIGLTIQDTSKHFVIINCTIDMCYEGIHLENVAAGTATIWGNTIFQQDCWVWETGPHAGITIQSSPGINISNNLIYEAGSEGILIENSEGCYIADNVISKQYTGISLESSVSSVIYNNSLTACVEAISCFESDFINVTKNNCQNNYKLAINIISSNFAQIVDNYCFNTSRDYWFSSGITLDSSINCTVKNCTIIDSYQGIYTSSTSNCQIYFNHIEDNSEYGVIITDNAESTTIYLNSFINNNLDGISQASDNGTSNYWYYSNLEQGNYWSDWNGTGSYSIAGSANAVDMYPLSESPL
ncbi:MAG: NosD domain-containing protein [Candidatus Thorarchaeota archaeon]